MTKKRSEIDDKSSQKLVSNVTVRVTDHRACTTTTITLTIERRTSKNGESAEKHARTRDQTLKRYTAIP